MERVMRFACIVVALVILGQCCYGICATAILCPEHDQTWALATGDTKTLRGVEYMRFHCPYDDGHDFWRPCFQVAARHR